MNKYQNFVLPKTYFVGFTQINLPELVSYLQDTDQTVFLEEIEKAKEEGLSDGEILCSFYAKLCYASLSVGKNKNITRIRAISDNILGTVDSGHGCYDGETEVMTQVGWKKWPDVKEDDIFATLNKNGNMEWQKSSKLFKYDYSGKMVRYDGSQIDLLITPNHNMFAQFTTTKLGRKKNFENFSLIKAEALLDKSHTLIKSLPNKLSLPEKSLDPIYQLLGFAIGDGFFAFNKLVFHLRRKRKIKYLNEICTKAQIELQIGEGDRYTVSLKKDPLQKFESLFRKIYDQNKEKIIPLEIFNNHYNDSVVLLSLLDGLMNSDGAKDKEKGSEIYDSTSVTLSGQVQFLGNLVGRATCISQAGCYKKTEKPNHKPNNRVYIYKSGCMPTINQHTNPIYPKSSLIQNWSGKVYCAEVPNHTLFVRRNGKTVWCGNSVFEHTQLNFVTRNCSRVFTHELVRHRVGSAFSQTSGRYVRTDRLDVIIDPILEPVYEEIEEARQFLENWYKRVEAKLDIVNEKSFARKKKLTSAMRRMLPNGQANEIGFSLNLRALRHLIELRTSIHAEWEIRLIFNQIYDLLKSKYPQMFADANVEFLDGANQITFRNKKI